MAKMVNKLIEEENQIVEVLGRTATHINRFERLAKKRRKIIEERDFIGLFNVDDEFAELSFLLVEDVTSIVEIMRNTTTRELRLVHLIPEEVLENEEW